MKSIFAFALAAGLAACASNTDGTPAMGFASGETVVVDNPGQVTVGGVTPARALGAVDSTQVAEHPAIRNGGDAPAPGSDASTEGAIKVEGAQASAVLSAIDPEKVVGPDGNPRKPD